MFEIKDVSKFGVVSVTEKHCSTSFVKKVELQAQIPQENKPGVMSQLTRKTTILQIRLYVCHKL
jgi:hypothetical protein